jgi:selenocysteine-specific elongation factor
VHVHLGAAHHTANVVLLDGDVLAPGQTGRVQLVLDAPVHAVPGDRFVIRNAQATATIGGGMVLDPFGPARKRRSAARTAWLDALAASSPMATSAPCWRVARWVCACRAGAPVAAAGIADRAPAGTLEVALQGGDTC